MSENLGTPLKLQVMNRKDANPQVGQDKIREVDETLCVSDELIICLKAEAIGIRVFVEKLFSVIRVCH